MVDRNIDVLIDRSRNHKAAVLAVIRREISPATAQRNPQWTARNNQTTPAVAYRRLASCSIAITEERNASGEDCEHFHPSARMRAVFSRTTGTSPFHPRSPPVNSNLTREGSTPADSHTILAIFSTEM